MLQRLRSIELWPPEDFTTHLEKVLTDLPVAGALVTFAVSRQKDSLLVLDPQNCGETIETIVTCRWLICDEVREARQNLDYGELLLGEYWIAGGAMMFSEPDRILVGAEREKRGDAFQRFPLRIYGLSLLGKLPALSRDPGFGYVHGKRIVGESGRWPGWIYCADRTPSEKSTLLVVGSPPLGRLIKPPLPPYDSAFAAIDEWFANAEEPGIEQFPSSALFSRDFRVIVPDKRGRILKAFWNGNTINTQLESKTDLAKLTLQGVAQTPNGKVNLPAVPGASNVPFSVPPDAVKTKLYLIEGEALLCETEVLRQQTVATPASPKAAPLRPPLGPYVLEDQPWFGPLPKIQNEPQASAIKRTVDVLIVVAVPVELHAVLRCLRPADNAAAVLKVHAGTRTYYIGRLGVQNVVVTMCEMGKSGRGGSLKATDKSINTWHPKAVVMPGIAFGANPAKQDIADVLVASKVIDYEPQRISTGATIFRGPIVEAGLTLLDRFRNVIDWKFTLPDGRSSVIRYGPFLSGEKLIDHAGFKARMLEDFPEAIGGDMETAGIYAAADSAKLDWIVVKAICDWGDGKKGDSHQALAAAAAVSLVEHVLSSPDVLSGLRRPEAN